MNINKGHSLVAILFAIFFLCLSGCTAEKVHTLGLSYINASGKVEGHATKNIYIAPVILKNNIQDSNYTVGHWQRLNNQKDVYQLGEKVTATFYKGLVKALAERGYATQVIEGWDLSPDQLSTFDKNILALKVEQFETFSYSTAIKVESQFIIKVIGYLGVPSENRVYRSTVNLQSTPINVSLSKKMVEEEFNGLYSEAIRRVTTNLLDKVK